MTTATNNIPNTDDLSLINTYARNPLAAEDVYCFNLTLCDNEVDRDFERFSLEALRKLCELFVGRTGISDHDMSSLNQKARIFRTWLEEDKSKKTSAGESYTALKARAYMLRTDENRDMITQIEGGIKKEVSVGCSMGSMTCSICGKSMKTHECNHIKGKYYGKKQCHGILSDAGDAYEWSFVAVPAQKNAGVTKAFSKEKAETENKTAHGTDSNAANENMKLYSKSYIKELEKQATDGRLYREHLTAEIRKYALIAMHKVDINAFMGGCEAMDCTQLKALAQSLKSQAEEILPVSLQLKAINQKKTVSNNNSFKI